MPPSEPLPSGRRMAVRGICITVMAVWVVLWPHNYGIDAHHWYWRLGAALLLTFRATFVGWCAWLFIMRPLLTIRTSGQRPVPSIPEALHMLTRGLPHD